MSKYNINFRNLIGGLMPQALRGNLLSLAWTLTHGVRVLHLRGLAARTQHWKEISFNSQYPLLQKLLNDECDPTNRGIRIMDNDEVPDTVVAYPNSTSYVQSVVGVLVVHPWHNYLYPGFVIVLPENLDVDKKRVVKLADTYKMTGTHYTFKQQ